MTSNFFPEFKFCRDLYKLCSSEKIEDAKFIKLVSDSSSIHISKRKVREITMCFEILIKKHACSNVFDSIEILARQAIFSSAFAHENSLVTLCKHLNHPNARNAIYQVILNGGVLSRIQAIAYVVSRIYSFNDPMTVNILELLDGEMFHDFDIFLAMIDFGNLSILKGILLLCSLFSRNSLFHRLLCTSSVRLNHILSLEEPVYQVIVEAAMFSVMTPAPLPSLEFYINRTLPNLRFSNEGDFKIKCKDGSLMCHRIILESAETSHFRTIWLQEEKEYEEKEYETNVVAEMLKHLYNGECEPSLALCRYADKIRMQSLCDSCCISLVHNVKNTTFEQTLNLLLDCYISPTKKPALKSVLANYYVCNYSNIIDAKKMLPKIIHWVANFILEHSLYPER